MLSQTLKYTGWFLLGIVALLVGLVILLQTTWFRGLIAGWVLEGINDNIQGQIVVGQIEGNLFRTLEIRGASLVLEEDTVASLERLSLEYEIGDLLTRNIHLREFVVEAPRLNLRESTDGDLNVLKAIAGKEPADEPDTAMSPFGWEVVIDTFRVSNGSAMFIPHGAETTHLSDLHLLASAHYSSGNINTGIHQLALAAQNPDLQITAIRLLATLHGDSAAMEIFSLRTRQNQLSGRAVWDFKEEALDFLLETGPVFPEEFGDLIGEVEGDFHPEVYAAGRYSGDSAEIECRIWEADWSLRTRANVTSLTSVPTYQLAGSFNHIDMTSWTGAAVPVSPFSGTFRVAGRGEVPETMTMQMEIDLGGFKYDTIGVDYLSVRGKIDQGSAEGVVTMNGSIGAATVEIRAQDIFGNPKIILDGDVSGLNLAAFAGIETAVSSSFRAGICCIGTGSEEVSLMAISGGSTIQGIPIDSFLVGGSYSRGVVRMDSMFVGSDAGDLRASGEIDTTGRFDAVFSARSSDLNFLAPVLALDTISGSADLGGAIAGGSEAAELMVDLRGKGILLGGTSVGDLILRTTVRAMRDSVVRALIPSFLLDWNGIRWVNSDTLDFLSGDGLLSFRSFALEADSQKILIDGELRNAGASNVKLEIRRFALSPFVNLFHPISVMGNLDLTAELKGEKENPQISGSILVSNAGYGKLTGGSLDVTFGLADSVMTWKADLKAREGNSIQSEGFVPLQISGTDAVGILSSDRSFLFSVSIDDFDLAAAGILSDLKGDFSGKLKGNLTLSGTADSVGAGGELRLRQGGIAYPTLGINYRDVQLAVSGRDSRLFLDTLLIAGGKGRLSGSGTIEIGLEDELRIRPDLSIRASEFDLLSSGPHQVNITGDVNLRGNDEGEVLFDGEITVNRSRFYVPAILQVDRRGDAAPPMLILAAAEVDSSFGVVTDTTESGGPVLPNFRGSISLKMPRGTWLRGPRMNVELRGELKVMRADTTTQILGHLAVEKGTYEFYARKFVVQQGRIDFEEAGKIDPLLYFEIEYSFRTDEVDNVLLMVIRGPSSKPLIEFFVNKEPVSEADAISYLIFGRKADDLNYGQKTTVNDMGSVLAADLAANMVNSQLSGVGSALGLDVVRVSGEDNWNKATLTAGKYITDDIYVAYERGITQTGSSSVAFEATMLEYYLMRFLYIRLTEATDKTSGVDLILKFD